MEVVWQREEGCAGQYASDGTIYKTRVSAGPKTTYKMKKNIKKILPESWWWCSSDEWIGVWVARNTSSDHAGEDDLLVNPVLL
jgi:hypothetical protein